MISKHAKFFSRGNALCCITCKYSQISTFKTCNVCKFYIAAPYKYVSITNKNPNTCMREKYSVAEWSNTGTSRARHIVSFTSHSWLVFLPVGRGAHDHSVNQDAVCHVWEGWVSQLQLCNDAEAKGRNRNTSGIRLCCNYTGLGFTAGVSDCKAFTSASASASLHRCTAASSRTHQTKNLEKMHRNRMCENYFLNERTATENMDYRKAYTFLTLFFCCMIKKKSQAIGWNSKGDSCSDLHGVYTDDFTILRGEIAHLDRMLYIIMSLCYKP